MNIKDKLYIATFQKDAVKVAAEYKVGLEFNHTCISERLGDEYRGGLISDMRRDLERSESEKALLHGPFTEIYPAAIDRRAREMAAVRLNEAFAVCRDLGVGAMVVHTGWLPFIYFKEWQAEKSAMFWQDFMKDKPYDFFIYIENVLEDEPYMIADMMKAIDDPRIKLCLDIGHANAMTQKNISVETWIQTLAPHIGHFHLHNNYGGEDSHGDFDSGSMNMESIFREIEKSCREDVTFTVEAAECRLCMEWLKKRGMI